MERVITHTKQIYLPKITQDELLLTMYKKKNCFECTLENVSDQLKLEYIY